MDKFMGWVTVFLVVAMVYVVIDASADIANLRPRLEQLILDLEGL